MQFYYGWWIVLIALTNMTLVVGASFNIFGLFVRPVSAEFGLSRANMNTAIVLLNFGGAIAAPFIGRLFDRVPIRRILVLGALAFGTGFIVLGLSHSLWLDTVIIFVALSIGLVGAGTGANPALVARWFTVHRGRAMAIAAIGVSLGGLALGPPATFLIASFGWRFALIVLGCGIASIILLLSIFVRGEPGPNDIEDRTARQEAARQDAARHEGGALGAPPLKARTILKMPQFWLIAGSVAVFLSTSQGFIVSVIPLAQGFGFSKAQVAGLLPALSLGGIGGKLLIAAIGDRFDRVLLACAIIIVLALANVASLFSHSYPSVVVCCALLGAGMGCMTPVFYALLADRFGQASFGTVNGLAFPLTTVFSSIVVRLSGEIFDRTGGYDWMFITFVGLLAVALVMMFCNRIVGEVA
jgi:MFS family permease